MSNDCNRLICLWGGISKPRNSKIPRRPDDESGEYILSIQNSERWVLPVRSVNKCRNNLSVIQKGMNPFSGTWLKAISISYKLSSNPSSIRGAWLVGPIKAPENKYDKGRVMLPEGDQTAQQIGSSQQRTIRRCGAANGYMVTATRTGMPAIEHKFFSTQSGQAASSYNRLVLLQRASQLLAG